MTVELNEYYTLRQELNISFLESVEALGHDRAGELAAGGAELTSEDREKMVAFSERRIVQREAVRKAGAGQHRSFLGE